MIQSDKHGHCSEQGAARGAGGKVPHGAGTFREEVILGEEEEDRVRLLDVLCQIANLLEVVDCATAGQKRRESNTGVKLLCLRSLWFEPLAACHQGRP